MRIRATLALLSLVLLLAPRSRAQAPLQDRIVNAVRDSEVTQLRGNIHPLARAEFDRGKAADAMLLPHVSMLFTMTPSQQAALSQLISEQQDRGSANYHRWLTPQEYGARFGLGQNDLNKVVSWLESRGFVVLEVAASRNAVSFSGSAAQVAAALHTEIHHYEVNGESHYANSSEPSVPAALAGVVSGFTGLNDFRPKPRIIRRNLPGAKPNYDFGQGEHFLAPDDFATIYDIQPLYSRGIDGTGQQIAIVGQSDIQLGDIREFRTLMGLPAKDPQIVLVPAASDPGMREEDLLEADLDLEWSGAVAKNATLIYVNAANAWDSLQYAVTSDLAPVISFSFSACEPLFTPSEIPFFISIGEQANAQGQTIVVASGDSGAAGCDDPSKPQATKGLAVNLPASLPYVTAVGGTRFNEGSGTYWGTSNDANGGSALSYVPEVAWNDNSPSYGIYASGGGASRLFSKPIWQFGAGVSNDGVRDVPDISLSASAAHDAYLICDETFNANTNQFTPVCPNGAIGGFDAAGGTSASTPAFAGVVALLDQSMNSPQGNINYILYALAGISANPFHDITSGSNAVPCQTNPESPDCPASGSSVGFIGYAAGQGYDMATGLGSVDANAMIGAWPSVTLSPDFDISVSPPNITLNRGGVATAQVTVSAVGGLKGAASFACQVPAIFVGVACSVANGGPNVFTLTLSAANGGTSAAPNLQTGWHEFGAGLDSLTRWLLVGGIVICWRAGRKRTRVRLLAAGCCLAAVLIGCAGGTSRGPGGPGGSASASIRLTPTSAYLGANEQQQFTATVLNSSNTSVNWSVSPAMGSISSVGQANGLFTAPSDFGANQSVTVTATSVANPSTQASATVLLVSPEAGAIQLTGSLNGMSHTVAISVKVN